MYKYLTNKYKNLPFFVDFNLYYNMENKEIKREIKNDKEEDNQIIVEEQIIDKTTSAKTLLEYIYNIDREAKTYLFFILKPFIISLITLIVFANLLGDFYEVVKINKNLTLISFIAGAFILSFIAITLLHILSIVYFKAKPIKAIINNMEYVQYIGYSIMIGVFIYYYLLGDERATYVYTCVVMIGTFSFFSYAVNLYLIVPLKLIIKKKLKFYRNNNDNKLILVEIQE